MNGNGVVVFLLFGLKPSFILSLCTIAFVAVIVLHRTWIHLSWSAFKKEEMMNLLDSCFNLFGNFLTRQHHC